MKKLGLIASYGAVTYVVKFCSQSLKPSINVFHNFYLFAFQSIEKTVNKCVWTLSLKVLQNINDN